MDCRVMEIDKRYKTSSIGIYNKDVFECPECSTSILNDYYKHICGVAETPIGTVSVKECPTCFTKYYSHLSETGYSLFLYSIKKGENLHFKPDKI